MSFASLLTHDLTIIHTTYNEASPDAYGQPAMTTSTRSVRGLVQPRSSREIADTRSAGTEAADYRIFMEVQDIDPADAVTFDGDLYQITGIARRFYGTVPHLTLDARRIGHTETSGS